VLFGVFAGAGITAVPGTILSVPVLAMVRVIDLPIGKDRLGVRPEPAGTARSDQAAGQPAVAFHSAPWSVSVWSNRPE
jgi:hypothetical protein